MHIIKKNFKSHVFKIFPPYLPSFLVDIFVEAMWQIYSNTVFKAIWFPDVIFSCLKALLYT